MPSPRVIVALTASVEKGGVYEQALHVRDAIPVGARQETVDAIVARAPLTGATKQEEVAVAFVRQLAQDVGVSDTTFAAAQAEFGDSGVVELIATAGYYIMLAHVHNALLVGR